MHPYAAILLIITVLFVVLEIVLSPYIPDGSKFLLQFALNDNTKDGSVTPMSVYSGRAPDSPSAATSPRTSSLVPGLNAHQLALLRNQLNNLRVPRPQLRKQGRKGDRPRDSLKLEHRNGLRKNDDDLNGDYTSHAIALSGDEDANEGKVNAGTKIEEEQPPSETSQLLDLDIDIGNGEEEEEDEMLFHSDDPIEARLREITELLIIDRQKRSKRSFRRQEKRQVVFGLANYFVLFLSLIAISAEIQARAPSWLSSLETQMKNVRNCAADQNALFQCVSNGDFAGLIASVILWLSRSMATKRIFLFGFETPKKLWTVVYESLVTAVCWGFSYIFIRRGLNPDTRHRFIQKYWKDAVYGSLAGFNAAFMKHVLKNLIPQEAVEDVLRERQLKILSWLPSFE